MLSRRRLLREDPGEAMRQVGMLDAQGRSAVHTGARCVASAGHAVGAHHPAPGEELFIPAGARHSARNIGPSTARWLYGYRRRG